MAAPSTGCSSMPSLVRLYSSCPILRPKNNCILEIINLVLAMEEIRGALDILAGLYAFAAPSGPHSLVLAGHCLSCAAALRAKHAGRKAKYLVGFLIVFLGGFGGSVVAGLLIQRPDLSPNPAFKDWRILPFTVVAWYLFEYTRLGDLLFRIPLVPSLCKLSLTFCRAGNICRVTELATKLYPSVPAAAIVLGTIGGTGGKMAVELILHSLGELDKPPELVMPSFALRSGFMGSLIYLCSVHIAPEDLGLNVQQGRALVISVLLLQALISTMYGKEVDITAPFKATFHAVTRIPSLDDLLLQEEKEKGKAEDEATKKDK